MIHPTAAHPKPDRLTVISSESMINSQITDTYTTLENLDLFMNAVTANFDKTKNIAIKAKSLEVSNNTMQHAGIISILTIFGIPLVILIYGFMRFGGREEKRKLRTFMDRKGEL